MFSFNSFFKHFNFYRQPFANINLGVILIRENCMWDITIPFCCITPPSVSHETPTTIPNLLQCGAQQFVHFKSRPDSLTIIYSGTITCIKKHSSWLTKSNILHKWDNAYLGQSTCHVIITYHVMDGCTFFAAKETFSCGNGNILTLCELINEEKHFFSFWFNSINKHLYLRIVIT